MSWSIFSFFLRRTCLALWALYVPLEWININWMEFSKGNCFSHRSKCYLPLEWLQHPACAHGHVLVHWHVATCCETSSLKSYMTGLINLIPDLNAVILTYQRSVTEIPMYQCTCILYHSYLYLVFIHSTLLQTSSLTQKSSSAAINTHSDKYKNGMITTNTSSLSSETPHSWLR